MKYHHHCVVMPPVTFTGSTWLCNASEQMQPKAAISITAA